MSSSQDRDPSKNPSRNSDKRNHRRDVSKTDSGYPGSSSQRSQPSVASGSSPGRGGSSPGREGYDYMANIESAMAGTHISDPSPFQIRPPEFFKRGRVFATERPSDDRPLNSRSTAVLNIPADSGSAQSFQGSGQIFVVIREDDGVSKQHCFCLQVNTYGRLGVARRGVVKADHGIIYSGRREPAPDDEEEPDRGEEGMCAVALRVQMRLPSEKLDAKSRIDYRTLRRFPKSLPVHAVGNIHKDSMAWLIGQFNAVQKRADDGESSGSEDNADDNEDEDDAPASSNRRIIYGNAGPSTQAPTLAEEAKSAKEAYHRYLNQGYTSSQAIDYLAQGLQKARPHLSWEGALAGVRGRLRAPSNAILI